MHAGHREIKRDLLALFRDDRHACSAYDYWSGPLDVSGCESLARPILTRISFAGGNDRSLLALCRYCLDLSLSVALLDRPPHALNKRSAFRQSGQRSAVSNQPKESRLFCIS